MKRPLRAASLAVVLAVSLAPLSCDGELPSDPVVDLAAVKAEAGSSGAGHAVTGKGTLWVPDPWNEWMNLSFTARQMPDGTVKGRWHHQFRRRAEGGRVIVEVECISVRGNEAWLGGRSIYAMNEDNIGRAFALYLIDNGEGGNAPSDQMTRTLWFGSDVQRMWDHCADMPTDHDVWPLAGGNVQIR